MKILITSDWYSPAVNGVVTSVKNLRRGLEERGHEVRILTLSQTTRSWEQDGVTYIGSVAAGWPGLSRRPAADGPGREVHPGAGGLAPRRGPFPV